MEVGVNMVAEGLEWKTPTGRVLFRDLSFTLNYQELLLISGPNGSGKSTLLRILVEELPIQKGKIEREFRRSEVGYVPQLQNMEFHLPISLGEVIKISVKGKVDSEQIEKLGLLNTGQLDRTWNHASGGERQRTLLTCTLLSNPKILVLDEPFNHLDRESHSLIISTLVNYLSAQRAVILVSHIGKEELKKSGVSVKGVILD